MSVAGHKRRRSALGSATPPAARGPARAREWGGERPERAGERHGNFDLWPQVDPVAPARSSGVAFARVFCDPRLACAPANLFAGAAVLDVGCGAGYASIEVAARGAHSVLGVDIDAALVAKARSLLRYVRAAAAPPPPPPQPPPTLPASVLACQRWRAPPPLPAPPHLQLPPAADAAAAAAGLARTRFLCADWVRGGGGLAPAPATFDVVLCFNVTKWVHLNGGDDALRALLFKAHEALRPGGHLLLVAQAWGSYARSRHLCHAFAAALPRLRLRPAHFLDFALDEVGFRLHSAVAVPRPSSPGTAQLLVLRKAA
jgi:7SK snRNA methylphosphate capping enzyme